MTLAEVKKHGKFEKYKVVGLRHFATNAGLVTVFGNTWKLNEEMIPYIEEWLDKKMG